MTPSIDIHEDGHVHTRLCNHAVGEMEDYVEQAVQRGLTTLIFLEHLETDIRYPLPSWLEDEDFAVYFREGERLKQQYRGVIDIRLGAETGFNPAAIPGIRRRLADYPFERVGMSCHFYRHGDVHLNLLSNRRQSLDQFATIGADTVITAYFNALTEAVAALDCDVLCHLDAVLRHLPGIRFNDGHRRQIEQLLDNMQAKNVALEINTSGFDYRGIPFPADWIVAEALRRGIPLRAGSDAHQPSEVGRHFDRLPAYLAAIPE
ncbi:histidinol-phosphatase [Desulfobulbus sp.]|uniref:histidinol-phosphatase n=1 Tax=Desulfobulbus sp. TaxID=895 RepID=UPI00286F1FBD|nr:histidinol-phosphatase [Desulfobulbus sp.]